MKTEYRQLTQLQLYRTGEYPCSYFPPRIAVSQMVAPADRIDDSNYGPLLDLGFRRSGTYVYRPQCPNCQACQSLRVRVQDFAPNRSQKRCWNHWQTKLHSKVLDLHFSAEHFELYQQYIQTRHGDGDMAHDTEAQYTQFFLTSPVSTVLVEFRDAQGALRMVSVIDQTARGLSAMYTFYDPAPEFAGLGTYGIIWQIETAREIGLEFAYLGYWIDGCQKMQYKQNFRPAETLRDGVWTPLP